MVVAKSLNLTLHDGDKRVVGILLVGLESSCLCFTVGVLKLLELESVVYSSNVAGGRKALPIYAVSERSRTIQSDNRKTKFSRLEVSRKLA